MLACTRTAQKNVQSTACRRATHFLEFRLERSVSVEDLSQRGPICFQMTNAIINAMVTGTKCVVEAGQWMSAEWKLARIKNVYINFFCYLTNELINLLLLTGREKVAIDRKCRKHLGCYKDDGRRILPKAFVNLSKNSPRKCSRHCRRNGYGFSGVQYRTQCFCGKELAERARKHSSYRRCNYPCPGNKDVKCGGSWAMNVYSGSGRPCM